MTAKKYIKSWMNIPSRGVTELTFFHPHLLGIKPPSQLYFEGHAGNYINSRIKGDTVVNAALDSALNREKQWEKKSSTLVKCDSIFTEISETQFIPTAANTINLACSTSVELPKIKQVITEKISSLLSLKSAIITRMIPDQNAIFDDKFSRVNYSLNSYVL